jgi:hypothetical protein
MCNVRELRVGHSPISFVGSDAIVEVLTGTDQNVCICRPVGGGFGKLNEIGRSVTPSLHEVACNGLGVARLQAVVEDAFGSR